MEELWRWDAIEIARAVRTRQISSHEAVSACLERIEQVNPRVNAVIELRPEEALAAADAADAAIARGETVGALHGVPVTIKVNVDQQGYATTNGVVAFRDKIATEDSPPVANWRTAGAVFIGRTNTPAFSHHWSTDNDLTAGRLTPAIRPDPGRIKRRCGCCRCERDGSSGARQRLRRFDPRPGLCMWCCRPASVARARPCINATHVGERPITAELMAVQGPLARTARDGAGARRDGGKRSARSLVGPGAPRRSAAVPPYPGRDVGGSVHQASIQPWPVRLRPRQRHYRKRVGGRQATLPRMNEASRSVAALVLNDRATRAVARL